MPAGDSTHASHLMLELKAQKSISCSSGFRNAWRQLKLIIANANSKAALENSSKIIALKSHLRKMK
jgi:hypothetical protein